MTPTQKRAMELALEALYVSSSCLDMYYVPVGRTTLPEIEEAENALRAALREPEPSITLHGYESLSATSDTIVYIEGEK